MLPRTPMPNETNSNTHVRQIISAGFEEFEGMEGTAQHCAVLCNTTETASCTHEVLGSTDGAAAPFFLRGWFGLL